MPNRRFFLYTVSDLFGKKFLSYTRSYRHRISFDPDRPVPPV